MRKFFILTLLLSSCLLSLGQGTLFVDEVKQEFTDISPYLAIYEDTTNNLTYDGIRKDSLIRFQPFDSSQKLNHENTYWAKLTVQSAISYDKMYVLHWKSMSVMRINLLEAYILHNGVLESVKKFGYFLKRSELEGTKDWDRFPFMLEEGEGYTFYFRIKNKYAYAPTFNLAIVEPEEQLIRDRNKSVIHLFYEGMLWVMIMYNLLVFFYTLDRAYLYYSLYMVSSAMYTLYFHKYILSNFLEDTPHANAYFWLVSLGLGTASYFMFIRHFLNTRLILSEKWNKVISWVVVIKLVIVVLEVILYTLFRNVKLLTDFVSVSIALESIFTIVLLVRLLKTKKKTVYFFMAGAVCLWVGIASSMVLYELGIDKAQYFSQVGIILEVLIFSLGLGYRMRKIEEEKNESAKLLIVELKKNKDFQEKANQRLEEEVKIRTAEITAQQEEITAQNEALLDTNNELQKTNKEVKDSIKYAKRIQEAVMPQPDEFAMFLKEYFIYFKPRDIVSGDFYWVKRIRGQLLIGAIDCTGHGVPGALLSMLGISFLNEISSNLLSSGEEFKANHILGLLREKVKESLGQHRNVDKSAKEAMDMALCIVDKEKGEVQFAGARNPLYVIREGNIVEFKGDRMPISMSRVERPFTNHIVKVQEDDVFYIFSDGMPDQFGGDFQDKLMTKRFKKILLGMANLPMHKQQVLLDRDFQDWKGYDKQVDDVLVMGFKV